MNHPRVILLTALVGAALCWSCSPSRSESNGYGGGLDQPPVQGFLQISTFGETAVAEAPSTFVSTFVNGPDYRGMDDNDLRGFLDGAFKYAWNQASQVHVRLGRRKASPRYGEYELFRVVQRWPGIELPPRSTVDGATLSISVEKGPAHELRVMLYAVNKDWEPGLGGNLRNNVSPPMKGEVWWNDRAFGSATWGLPGAGFASDEDPEADTPAMPLAEAHYVPDGGDLVFDSPELADYASQRIRDHRPLLFLVKLSDYQEDIPGTLLTVWSGNQGDSRNVARRPRLRLTWSSVAERESVARRVLLEHGRSFDLSSMDSSDDAWLAWSFTPDADGVQPTVQFRETAGQGREWSRMKPLVRTAWDSSDLRLLAVHDPHILGQTFASDFADTWVRTAAPEEQEVVWRFLSPTGVLHEVQADYEGDYRWAVRFTPNELGPWRYDWSHRFTKRGFRSPPGTFDVILGGTENALGQLTRMRDDLSVFDGKPPQDERDRWMTRFARFERALMDEQTAQSFAEFQGTELRALLHEVRAHLGRPVPDPIPMKADTPPSWAR